ncbi:MAG: hypothetical protein A2849_00850 [Candidatus Taylorbacteria bacterium RIFCSPHIGHO2_01_FULL_51_15]|uniref:Uncharacterized protein n=1 Tax=Candidatus Taylorbacteria bacterium RIFCSPHIGHO2_01_FULL_51_15 TaxID=1802304 RepID=A0A1G2M9E1_9BACT|nr:MAG: hypothetical protein A2849_00850 [Candidatus Taylorbacteria bacterium RIFCSPHIGHO2_01_FULL_51_15]
MKQRTFNQAAGTIFLVLGLLHLCRILQGWEAVINGWKAPMSLSYAVVIVAGYLSYHAFSLAKRDH